jgi:hypothetical protein
MNFAIEEFENVVPESQNNDNAIYYEGSKRGTFIS